MNASEEEFIEALGRLTELERLGLLAVARHYARGESGFTGGDDLLSEAIYRVADGRRKWPKRVPLERFLINVMRSVVSGARQRADMSRGNRSLDDEGESFDALGALACPSAEEIALGAERRRQGGAAIEFARRTLRNDQSALSVLEGIAEDFSASEMREAFGLDHAQFHAARQRVMSRLTAFARKRAQ